MLGACVGYVEGLEVGGELLLTLEGFLVGGFFLWVGGVDGRDWADGAV